MNFQGHIEKGMVVLDQPLPLPDGTPVRVEAISPVASDFWRSYSLDELARRQKTPALWSVEELLGGWPKDELHDDFEESFHDWRQRERE